jgi:phage tail sheath protein FI
MVETFLHGVEVVEIDKGPRPIQTVRSAIIGIVGTAPGADAEKFPLDTPVLIAGSRSEAAALGLTGTLPNAVEGILDQAGALIIVVRVAEGVDGAATKSNVLGGVDVNGNYKGVQVFLGAESILGYAPRILIAPGFTGERSANGVAAISVSNGGSGYPSAPEVAITSGGGTGATAQAVVNGGVVTAINVLNPGSGYTSNPTVTINPVKAALSLQGIDFKAVTGGTSGNSVTVRYVDPASNSAALAVSVVSNAITVNLATNGSGGLISTRQQVIDAINQSTPASALLTATLGSGFVGSDFLAAVAATNLAGGGGTGATATASRGTVRDSVVAEMLGVADRLRAVIIADGPNTTDAAAIQYRNDFGSARVYVVDPKVVVDRNGALTQEPLSPRVAGIICRVDNQRGFWWSPSNQEIYGISGVARPIDFTLGDVNSRANLLNENEVTTVIRTEGFRLWGNRTCSTDPKFAFLSVRRTADIIQDSILRAHLWAVDRNITRTYVEDVTEGVNDYIRHLKNIGAVIDGFCWADPADNTPDQVAQGKVTFSFDFTPPYPAERVTFKSILTNEYLTEIFA